MKVQSKLFYVKYKCLKCLGGADIDHSEQSKNAGNMMVVVEKSRWMEMYQLLKGKGKFIFKFNSLEKLVQYRKNHDGLCEKYIWKDL